MMPRAKTSDEELTLLVSYQRTELSMSNYDHHIDPGMSDVLKSGSVRGQHFGWNFCGEVWWDSGQFCERVARNGVHVGTYCAPTLESLMSVVNDAWGWA